MTNYVQVNLISNIDLYGRKTDPNLVNPWGLIQDQKDNFWIAANGPGLLLHYDRNYDAIPPVVTVPSANGTDLGSPSGLVLNTSKRFNISKRILEPATIITVTEDGLIGGYNKSVDPSNVIVTVSSPGASYKGVAIGDKSLFAANFLGNMVEKYDGNWKLTTSFTDQSLVDAGYGPFNVFVHKDHLYVFFAEHGEGHDDAHGSGNGFIDIFSFDGKLIRRLVNRGALNSPWGAFIQDNKLYVGNFGDGVINVYNNTTGELIGPLRDRNNNIITIDGLWGILPVSRSVGKCDCKEETFIYLNAGIIGESAGLFAYLKPV
jgi:uncharacterized protein (TIGR03118 family)